MRRNSNVKQSNLSGFKMLKIVYVYVNLPILYCCLHTGANTNKHLIIIILVLLFVMEMQIKGAETNENSFLSHVNGRFFFFFSLSNT